MQHDRSVTWRDSSCVIRIQMCLRSSFAAFLLALTAGGALNAQTPALETVSIIHVTVVDIASGRKLPDQTVLLQSERILSVSAFDSSNPPQGRVIDAHGRFLIPGLWDMHAHIQDLEDLPLYVANGVTGVRLMFGSKHTPSLRAKIASAPPSFCSPPIPSPTFTTPLRFKPCGSAENISI